MSDLVYGDGTPVASGGYAPHQSFGKLAEALAKAQAAFTPPRKGKTATVRSDKGNYSYSYADLAEVFDAIRKPLADNGLAVSQNIGVFDGVLSLETRLMHSSGEQLVARWPLPTGTLKPQEWGSLLTYYRRYSLTAIVGVAADDDDDGNVAQGNNATTEQKTTTTKAAPVDKPSTPVQPAGEVEKPAPVSGAPAASAPVSDTPVPKDAAPEAEVVKCKTCGKKMAKTDVNQCKEKGLDMVCWNCRRKAREEQA
jgi:hypothetical protein